MYLISIALGIAQFLLICVILVSEVNKKSPGVFLWATIMLMFGVPHLFTVIFRDMSYSTMIIAKSSAFVILFSINYLIIRSKSAYSFINVQAPELRLVKSETEKSVFECICFLVFIVSILGYVFFTIRAQGGLLNTSWGNAREIQTSYVSVTGLFIRLAFTFSGLSLYYFCTNRIIKAGLIVLMFMVLITVTRNRVQILPIFIFFITLFLMRIKTIKIRHIVIAAAMGVAVIYAVYAIRAIRYLGTLSDAINNVSFSYINSMVKMFISSNNGELALRRYFYYFIEQDNDFDGFNRAYTYIRMLLVFLPTRWSFGLKPQSFDLYMGKAVGLVAGGSMHPTLFGDCFGNLGWAGIFLGLFWGAFVNVTDKIIEKQPDDFSKIMVYFLASYALVVIGRGSVYNGFEVYAWGTLLLYITNKMLGALKLVHIIDADKQEWKTNRDPEFELIRK